MTAPVVHIDYETASAIDLTKVGLWRYARHPSTRVLILRYRFGHDGPVLPWKPGDEPPWDLLAHIEQGDLLAVVEPLPHAAGRDGGDIGM